MRARNGFTLIELLVAVLVMAVLFAIGYGTITQALEQRERVRVQQQRLTALQNAVRTFVQDFAQLAPRPVHDRVGSGLENALQADPRSAMLVRFTRRGWANPAGLQRPALQRVEYLIEGDRLIRVHWPVLDAIQSTEAVRRELLTGVRSVKLRFMESGGTWLEEWPSAVATAAAASLATPDQRLRYRPIAVEVALELEDLGRITRLIEVGG
jgi:general secretion pathway protein J